jgi:hypothetical protein
MALLAFLAVKRPVQIHLSEGRAPDDPQIACRIV